MEQRVYVVLGAGPGLGLATARRFAREGYAAALVARHRADAEPLTAQLRDSGGVDAVPEGVDLADPADVGEVVGRIGEHLGRIDVLHFNPSVWRETGPLDLTVEELLDDVRVGAAALLPAVQAARPLLPVGGRVLVTGSEAADRPWHGAASLGVQKAAVRNLVTSLDAALAPAVRAVAVQVNGLLAEEGPFSPPAIADALFAAASRPDEGWTAHVPYDG